jgi:hypothetical protein
MKLIPLCALFSALMTIQGCHQSNPPEDAAVLANSPRDAATATPEKTQVAEPLVLTREQVTRIGLQTEPIKATQFADEIAGFGLVTVHEAIAQAMAEWVSAKAVEKQSQAALARTQKLSGTAGAMSADTEEAAARQAAVDAAAATLARQHLSGVLGQKLPWDAEAHPEILKSLASGDAQLLRVTFPLGSLPGNMPVSLRVARLGTPAGGKSWKISSVWAAPADSAVPGRSFFGLLHGQDLAEGERLVVFAPLGAPLAGVLVPQEAVLLSDGKYWCYIEQQSGSFQKREVDIGRPFEAGYFLTEGFKPGEKVVTQGAAHLLAQQSNNGTEPD